MITDTYFHLDHYLSFLLPDTIGQHLAVILKFHLLSRCFCLKRLTVSAFNKMQPKNSGIAHSTWNTFFFPLNKATASNSMLQNQEMMRRFISGIVISFTNTQSYQLSATHEAEDGSGSQLSSCQSGARSTIVEPRRQTFSK